MPLAHDADQRLYADGVERLFSGLPEGDRIRALIRDDRAPAPAAVGRLWGRLVQDLGATALPLTADLGGGATWREVGIVLEGAGRHLVAAPYATVMAAVRCLTLLTGTGSLLARAAEGHRYALAVPGSAWKTPSLLEWHAGTVRGTVRAVLDAAHAQTWLVPVEVDGSLRVAVTDAATVTERSAIDLTRSFGDVSFDGPATLLDGDADEALAGALSFAAAAIAVEAIGGAQHCVHLTVDYAKVRTQFGRPVGSMQAIKHALADVARVVEPAKAAAYAALEAVTLDDPDQQAAAALAKLTAVEAYVTAAGQAIQLHGAIGFTWEHDLHLHFKRAITDRALFGNTAALRRTLAEQLLRQAAMEVAS